MKTITLEQIQQTAGVQSVSAWQKGTMKRHYLDVGQAATKVWWEEDGKLRLQDGRGRDSSAAIETIERLIGCDLIDRRSQAADYVIIK
ncbi:hypothetical protein [Modicisalibacter sp. MOD 31.J]|uniref:hypothetical protein n=1 Tax=Modicisalibacter sp. MOD 31.J TaxID=2831897 RepID=UPI001CCA512E|nr:hypothetical protein [Modicisalibacter sp. MOD 31.J]MBZ9576740.1 hypothetical protein [Modicisalibacter sp. MOD 31.J]